MLRVHRGGQQRIVSNDESSKTSCSKRTWTALFRGGVTILCGNLGWQTMLAMGGNLGQPSAGGQETKYDYIVKEIGSSWSSPPKTIDIGPAGKQVKYTFVGTVKALQDDSKLAVLQNLKKMGPVMGADKKPQDLEAMEKAIINSQSFSVGIYVPVGGANLNLLKLLGGGATNPLMPALFGGNMGQPATGGLSKVAFLCKKAPGQTSSSSVDAPGAMVDLLDPRRGAIQLSKLAGGIFGGPAAPKPTTSATLPAGVTRVSGEYLYEYARFPAEMWETLAPIVPVMAGKAPFRLAPNCIFSAQGVPEIRAHAVWEQPTKEAQFIVNYTQPSFDGKLSMGHVVCDMRLLLRFDEEEIEKLKTEGFTRCKMYCRDVQAGKRIYQMSVFYGTHQSSLGTTMTVEGVLPKIKKVPTGHPLVMIKFTQGEGVKHTAPDSCRVQVFSPDEDDQKAAERRMRHNFKARV